MRTHIRALVAIALLGTGPALAAEEPDGTVVAGEIGAALDAVVAKTDGFWGAVLVARGGEVLLAKGYGFSDYAAKPNTPRTLFEIASASKQFTAAAILRLEQQRKLSTSDPLSKFFPDAPEETGKITVHELLTHTSGLSPEAGVPYASRIGRAEYVKQMLAVPLASPRGEKFAYANAGYALLAAVVEAASGKSFEDYVAREVFRRARLEETGFIGDRDLIRSGRAAKRLAPGDPPFTAADWHWGWGYRGMGGVVTTVLDLERWDRALRADDVLSAASREKLVTPALERYAYGWIVATTERGTRRADHGGSVMGFGCYLSRYLEDDAFVAVLSNGKSNVFGITAGIDRILFPPPRIEAVVDAGKRELNEYRSAALGNALRFEAKRDGETVVLSLRDEPTTPLVLRLPVGAAMGLATSLESAIAAREKDDAGGPPAMEGGLYLLRYGPGRTRLELSEGLTVRIQPMYVGQDREGKRIEDRRAVLIVDDTKAGQWPAMVKMNVAAAKLLLARLREAAK